MSYCTHACFYSREESTEAALELLHHLFLNSLFKIPDQKLINHVVIWTQVRILKAFPTMSVYFALHLPFLLVNYSSAEAEIHQHKLHKREQELLKSGLKNHKFMYVCFKFLLRSVVSYFIFNEEKGLDLLNTLFAFNPFGQSQKNHE